MIVAVFAYHNDDLDISYCRTEFHRAVRQRVPTKSAQAGWFWGLIPDTKVGYAWEGKRDPAALLAKAHAEAEAAWNNEVWRKKLAEDLLSTIWDGQ